MQQMQLLKIYEESGHALTNTDITSQIIQS